MSHVKLLDCTLRDGAYLIDKTFGDNTIHGIISGLLDANVDIIEIGFLQNSGFGEGKTVFKNGLDAERFIPKPHGKTMFSVLADFSRYSVDNLNDNNGKSFDIVRSCFFKSERYEALNFFRAVKEKGYKLFIQPVDTLGYTDKELIEYIELINDIEPYCFSIVDTFGSMYEEDLQRVFYIIDNNLNYNCRIGFHSHNNMQMSNALSQAFMKMSTGSRELVVDATISGMGRGAGNTPTELIANYMVEKQNGVYNIDALLDIIDDYITSIRTNVTWGYNTQMFLAGIYSAHINNISYLKEKNSIRSRDVRFILNEVGAQARKRYHYDLLEKTYLEYMKSDIDDENALEYLRKKLSGKNILIMAPGKTVIQEEEKIQKYIAQNGSVVISINFIPTVIAVNYLYINNIHRYKICSKEKNFEGVQKILTSNITTCEDKNAVIIAFNRLFKCGWEHSDNSTILLLRLLNILGVNKIGIAGLDGYDYCGINHAQYAESYLEIPIQEESAASINKDLFEMLQDFRRSKSPEIEVEFVTQSRFEEVFESRS